MTPELTLYDYWRIINRRKWSAIIIFSSTLLSTAIYTKFQPNIYSSSAIINTQPPNIYSKLPGAEVAESDPWGAVSTEIKVIASMEIASRSAGKLNYRLEKSGSSIRFSPNEIIASYKAERVQDSNLISITARSDNPYKANDIVNAVIASYIEYDLEQRSLQAKKTLDDIISRKNDIEEKLRSLERQKKNFIEKNPKTAIGNIYAEQLANLEIKRKDLLEKYTPNHPEISAVDNRIEVLQNKLSRIPSQELELARIIRDLRLQEELYSTISKQYEEAKLGLSSIVSFVKVVNPSFVNHNPISPNVRLNMSVGILLGLFLSVIFVFIMENLDVSINTIEEIENFIKLPVLGLVPNIASEKKLDDILTNIFKKERFGLEAFRSALLFNKKYSVSVIESYHTLRANVISTIGKKGPISIVFSSSGVAEGKSLTAINFSLAAANSGLKTLLIDADMRRPVIHEIFGISKQPGFSEVLAKKYDYRDVLRESSDFLIGKINAEHIMRFSGIENLRVITCGTTPANVVDLMDNADWESLIASFKTEFDIIIFDSPPVLLFIDPVILAKKNDGSVLIYKSGKIARGALKRAKEQITGVNARMIGVVLNGVRASEMGLKHGYYYDYSRYLER